MKNNYFVKAGMLVAACLLGSTVPVQAQVQDSLCYSLNTARYDGDSTHRLKVGEVLLPAAIVGTSALFVGDGWLSGQREHVQDVLSAKGKRKFKIDEYSQYAPMAAVYGLGLCGVKGKHGWKDRTGILAMSYAAMGILVNTMKYSFREKRPDSNARNSFPSGHTATAFMGAEFLYREYRDVSPWIGYAGYAVAAATGYLRIYNDRHYVNDVVAGACIGIVSTKLAYWLYPKCFGKGSCPESYAIAGMPYYSSDGYGLNVCILF